MTRHLTLLKAIVLLGYAVANAPQAKAHPHNWIDVVSIFVLDGQGKLQQLNQRWKFDPFYSLMTYADLMNEYGNAKTGLSETAESMVSNLKSYQYFSELYLDDVPVEIKVPFSSSLKAYGDDADMRLVLEMGFKFTPALDIQSKSVALRVYDPTYFIAMNHKTAENIKVTAKERFACKTSLDIPSPSQEVIDYALSLDRFQTETGGLGIHFAETALVDCSSSGGEDSSHENIN